MAVLSQNGVPSFPKPSFRIAGGVSVWILASCPGLQDTHLLAPWDTPDSHDSPGDQTCVNTHSGAHPLTWPHTHRNTTDAHTCPLHVHTAEAPSLLSRSPSPQLVAPEEGLGGPLAPGPPRGGGGMTPSGL